MKKSHGPSFRKTALELVQCPACHGRAITKGVFYELPCDRCIASGWVSASGEDLTLEELVTQLSLNLKGAVQLIEELKKPRATGPEALYQEGNRLGAGGSNYTGD
ncbi:hypothetical protein [Pseudomonas guariconensis]|uniref:hypothetical protein n=1 Tax=Pseudomonas guariconensis TaxID=1288410 RepID=UPI002B057FAC|nr:hypothetical protein [Pseudomonas guariconensis]